MSSGASLATPPPASPGTVCWICLEEGPEDSGGPLRRDCSCRGTAGYVHASCLADYSRRKSEDEYEKLCAGRLAVDAYAFVHPWIYCPTCEQRYVGIMALAQAEAFVESTRHLDETDARHFEALQNLAERRRECGDVDGSQELYRHLIEVLKTIETIDTRGREALLLKGLARTFVVRKEFGEAVSHFEKARQLYISKYGPSNQQVLQCERIIRVLKREMDSESRDTRAQVHDLRRELERARREKGKGSHRRALQIARLLADALFEDGQTSEAIELMEESLDTSRRVHGPDHPDTTDWEKDLRSYKLRFGATDISRAGAASPSSASVAIKARVTGTTKPQLNGRQVTVLRMSKDGKYVVLTDERGKPTKFKAEASNLVFADGTPVFIQGLTSMPQLNGRRGVVRSYDRERGRYEVATLDEGCCRLLKAGNLEVIFP